MTAIVYGNEVTNPIMVTEVYTKNGDTLKLASLSYTRINDSLTKNYQKL